MGLQVFVKRFSWTDGVSDLSVAYDVVISADFAKRYSVVDQTVHCLQSFLIGSEICAKDDCHVILDSRIYF